MSFSISRYSKFLGIALLIGLSLVFIACEDKGTADAESKGNQDHATAFSIQGSYPGNGAKNVSLDSKVKITFNKPISQIDSSSITLSSFVMSDNKQNTISGEFNFSGSSLIFTPSDELQPNTKYTVQVTTAVRDKSGNPLSLPFTLVFTTGDGSNSSGDFRVISTSPQSNTTEVDVNSRIIIYSFC